MTEISEVKVLLYGVGAVGSLIAKHLLEKPGVRVIGAVDIAEDKIGKDLGDILGLGKRLGVVVSNDLESAVSDEVADIAVHATSSKLKDTYQQIASILKRNINVLSTCEELSYPYYSESKLADDMNALAQRHEVTVLGTGINPGFLMDTLVIALTAVCQRIERIEVTRVMDAATRRLPFQKKIGAGLSVQDFHQRVKKAEITGHVGLKESIAMIAASLKWDLDKIVDDGVEPVIADKLVASSNMEVKAGEVAGIRQKAKGVLHSKEVVKLDFQAFIGAEEEYDSILIDGIPRIEQKIQPCVHGDEGTVAMIANSIPRVLNAPSGLFTMKDLQVPSATPEDMREYINL